jgi:hypothetical protein
MTMSSERSARANIEARLIAAAYRVANNPSYVTIGELMGVIEEHRQLGLADPVGTGRGAVGHNAPDTSIEAADSLRAVIGPLRRNVMNAIYAASQTHLPAKGITCDSVERRLKKAHTSVSSAINWLRNHGYIYDTGRRSLTAAGRKAIVWEPTPAAWELLRKGKW